MALGQPLTKTEDPSCVYARCKVEVMVAHTRIQGRPQVQMIPQLKYCCKFCMELEPVEADLFVGQNQSRSDVDINGMKGILKKFLSLDGTLISQESEHILVKILIMLRNKFMI